MPRQIKTIRIQLYDPFGNKVVTGLTMDWELIKHNDMIDLCPLMEKLHEDVASKNASNVG